MSFRAVRQSKFRHVFGKEEKRDMVSPRVSLLHLTHHRQPLTVLAVLGRTYVHFACSLCDAATEMVVAEGRLLRWRDGVSPSAGRLAPASQHASYTSSRASGVGVVCPLALAASRSGATQRCCATRLCGELAARPPSPPLFSLRVP